jgi:ATP-dependent DNA helicase RecQ
VLVDRFGLAAFRLAARSDRRLLEGSGRCSSRSHGRRQTPDQLPAVAPDGRRWSSRSSLAEDQVGLGARGIPSTFLASTLDSDERRRRLHAMRSGAFKIVYVAPERLALEGFAELMGDIRLSLLAVDEAHCIVQWGHDFRPDYLRIGALIDRLRPRRVIACTATATPASQREILQRLKFDSSRTKVILRGFARPNLELSVLEVDGAKGALAGAEDALERALGGPRGSRSAARATGIGGGAIVYAATRRTSENIARQLEGRGWKARAYHAGLPAAERSSVQKAFADRSLPVVVATNAFGMGIDRADVRAVVHAQPPASIENYYREVGRRSRRRPRHSGASCSRLVTCCCGAGCASSGPTAVGCPSKPEIVGLFRELALHRRVATCLARFHPPLLRRRSRSLGGCGHA